jgi:hypothetical protein
MLSRNVIHVTEWTEDNEDAVLSEISKWLHHIKTSSHPFADCLDAVDPGPIPTNTASKSVDPYRDFSWETRLEYPSFTWEGRRDKKGRITGDGVIVFENGDEITGFFRNGMREGAGCSVTTRKARSTLCNFFIVFFPFYITRSVRPFK